MVVIAPRGHTHEWSTELDSPVLCGTGIRTRTRHQASVWRNKSRTRIISWAHPRTIFCRPCDPSLPPSCTHLTRAFRGHVRRTPTVAERGNMYYIKAWKQSILLDMHEDLYVDSYRLCTWSFSWWYHFLCTRLRIM